MYTHTGSEAHLHILLHGGDVDLISDLQLVMVAGVHQHLVIESPVPHLTSGILRSLERERIIWQSHEITVWSNYGREEGHNNRVIVEYGRVSRCRAEPWMRMYM